MKRYDHYKKRRTPTRPPASIVSVKASGKVDFVSKKLARTGRNRGQAVVILKTNDGGFIACDSLMSAMNLVVEFGFFIFMVKQERADLTKKLSELYFTHVRDAGAFSEYAPPRAIIFTGE